MDRLTLKDYQQWFSQAALQGEQSEGHACLLETLTPGGTLTAPDAIQVYGEGVIVRLTEALGETYEAVWWVCGDEEFFALTRHFIQACPSTTYNLSKYGKEFPDFLAELQPFPDLPFLGDLARFEWLFKDLFHTAQHESVSPDRIQTLGENPNIRFRFGPAARLFGSPFAIYDLWKLRGTAHDGKPPVEWDQPQRLLLYKKTGQIFINTISDAEFDIILALQQGSPLEVALESAVEAHPALDQQQIGLLFQMMFHTGIIQHIEDQVST